MPKTQEDYQYFEEINPGVFGKIGSGLKVLDIGCGYGTLGEAISKKGNEVYGLDISHTAIEKAKERISFACVVDITRFSTLPDKIKKEKFDLIVLADILEHINNPSDILINIKSLLKENGQILLSIPNVANWATRLQLLFGYWEYATSGVMDRTHIRFFTLGSIKKLLKATGYKIVDLSVTPYFLRVFSELFKKLLFSYNKTDTPQDPTALIKSPYYCFYMKFFYPFEFFIASCWKTMFAFQFIIIAKPKFGE